MRRLLDVCCLSACLLLASAAPLIAQQPVQPQPDAQKTEEPKRADGQSPVVPYTLAALATVIVMVLVCMPARRE